LRNLCKFLWRGVKIYIYWPENFKQFYADVDRFYFQNKYIISIHDTANHLCVCVCVCLDVYVKKKRISGFKCFQVIPARGHGKDKKKRRMKVIRGQQQQQSPAGLWLWYKTCVNCRWRRGSRSPFKMFCRISWKG
jgi:hypothetical protein